MNHTNYSVAAMECARYIFDSQSEQESYLEYIKDGNDPREHIMFHAAIVLDQTDDFEVDIEKYLEMENVNG